jgi:maleylacetoacetate isomerase
MQLHSFFNSSTSYRVRIALALKGLAYDCVPVNIRAFEHREPAYVALNASANVPTLTDGAFALGQSLAIIDYLDATHPEPRLIPQGAEPRARVLELAALIACDIHPVNNLRVLRYLTDVLGASPAQREAWYAHWIGEGLAGAERLLEQYGGAGPYCFGAHASLADCCLVPQVANALRMRCATDAYPRVMAVYRHCIAQAAFQAAAPERQPDFVA